MDLAMKNKKKKPDFAIVQCDGACEPKNPGGIAAYGWHATLPNGNQLEGRGIHAIGPGATNNVAEYAAAIEALNSLANYNWKGGVRIESDSQLLVCQASGIWRVNSENLYRLLKQLRSIEKRFQKVTYRWIPREKNQRADCLSRQAVWEKSIELLEPKTKTLKIKKIDEDHYLVSSQSVEDKWYRVTKSSCDCPAFQRISKVPCKHIAALTKYLAENPGSSPKPQFEEESNLTEQNHPA